MPTRPCDDACGPPEVSAVITNATTTLGGLCFLAGALMLVPEERKARDAVESGAT